VTQETELKTATWLSQAKKRKSQRQKQGRKVETELANCKRRRRTADKLEEKQNEIDSLQKRSENQGGSETFRKGQVLHRHPKSNLPLLRRR